MRELSLKVEDKRNNRNSVRLPAKGAVHAAFPVLILLLVLGPSAEAQDAFAKVRCGSSNPNVGRTFIGMNVPSGPVEDIERKHRDIGLKDQGTEEISSTLNLESWIICGSEYDLLVDQRNVIRDAVQVPQHYRRMPLSFGACQRKGHSESLVLAILDNPSPPAANEHYSATDKVLLHATAAWHIDEAKAKIVQVDLKDLSCPRSNIITVDGGM